MNLEVISSLCLENQTTCLTPLLGPPATTVDIVGSGFWSPVVIALDIIQFSLQGSSKWSPRSVDNFPENRIACLQLLLPKEIKGAHLAHERDQGILFGRAMIQGSPSGKSSDLMKIPGLLYPLFHFYIGVSGVIHDPWTIFCQCGLKRFRDQELK